MTNRKKNQANIQTKSRFCFLFGIGVFLLTLVSCTRGNQVDGVNYEINDLFATVVSVDASSFSRSGAVSIPSEVTIDNTKYTVKVIGDYAFEDCVELVSITLPEGLVSIGASAFRSCYNLKTVTFPNSLKVIEAFAFDKCDNLTKVKLPKSMKRIGERAFAHCYGLSQIVLPDLLPNLEKEVFYKCILLENVTFPMDMKTLGDGAFAGCSALKTVVLQEGLFSIGESAFEKCSQLTSISLPSSITMIGKKAFLECQNLTSVQLPDGLTSIDDYVFRECSSLSSILLPSHLTSFAKGVFYGCSSLSTIAFPASLTLIGTNILDCCKSLESIEVDKDNPAFCSINGVLFTKDKTVLIQYPANNPATTYTIPNSVKSIASHAFYRCGKLTSVAFPQGLTSIGGYAFVNCSSLTSIDLPSSVKILESHAFAHCPILSTVKLTEGLTSIGGSAFAFCNALSTIHIPASVKTIGVSAFSNCEHLKAIEVAEGSPVFCGIDGVLFGNNVTTLLQYPQGKMDTYYVVPPSVKFIVEDAFGTNPYINSVKLPDNLETIEANAFSNCLSLASITIPKQVQIIGKFVFIGCNQLAYIDVDKENEMYCSDNGVLLNKDKTILIHYPIGRTDSTYAVPENVVVISELAFLGSPYLTSISIPKKTKSILMNALYRCSKMESIEVEDGNTAYASQKGVLFSKDMKELIRYPMNAKNETYIIPDGVEVIRPNAFESNVYLTSVTLPASVKELGWYAFNGCVKLTSMTSLGILPPKAQIAFGKLVSENCTLHIPIGSKTSYSISNGWLSIKSMVDDVKVRKAR